MIKLIASAVIIMAMALTMAVPAIAQVQIRIDAKDMTSLNGGHASLEGTQLVTTTNDGRPIDLSVRFTGGAPKAWRSEQVGNWSLGTIVLVPVQITNTKTGVVVFDYLVFEVSTRAACEKYKKFPGKIRFKNNADYSLLFTGSKYGTLEIPKRSSVQKIVGGTVLSARVDINYRFAATLNLITLPKLGTP
jgi:hypothetical protein